MKIPDSVREQVAQGNTIYAIKKWRDLAPGLSLKDAYNAIRQLPEYTAPAWRKPDEWPLIHCASPENLISVLEGWAVHVRTKDRVEASGILTQFVPQDGTKTMIQIRTVVGDELILATDVRNLASIEVP